MNPTLLPAVNASLNFTSASCLLLGYIFIQKKNVKLHRLFMISAFLVSSVFLASYLYYHYHFPAKTFPDLGWIKVLYLGILFTHIVLAVVMLPMIFTTFFKAFKGQISSHRKWAKFTFPIWSYVSVTGVIIYFMLYQWFEGVV